MWFRQDLRIQDNAALWHASQNGQCIAFVALSPKQWQQHHDATIKIDFYLRQLKTLQDDLAQKNIPLIVKQIDEWKDIPHYLEQLTQKLDIEHIYANAELGIHEQQRDQKVKNLKLFQDRTLFPVKSVRNKSNEPYKVFTPFKKACYERLHQDIPSCYPTIKKQAKIECHVQSDRIDDVLKNYQHEQAHWDVTETHAHQLLQTFIKDHVKDYKKERDFPAHAGTSQLSAYLNIGILSTRQCLNALFAPYDG